MPPLTDTQEAQRLAEQVVGDLAFYNRERIRRSLRDDRFFEEMASELDEAKRLYLDRVDPELENRHNLFNRAVVDLIIKPSESEETTIW